ncbi:MAG: hypothetical protein JW945_00455 [Methanomicrobia archaeon]|nr:hypothetical protein [Methanomicrobia archaeon]
MPVEEFAQLKDENVVHLKGVLQSTDGGKTWIVVKQDALVNIKGQPLSVDLKGLVLKRARKKGYAIKEYDKLHGLAEPVDATDTGAMTQLLSHWYDRQE